MIITIKFDTYFPLEAKNSFLSSFVITELLPSQQTKIPEMHRSSCCCQGNNVSITAELFFFVFFPGT